MSFYIDFKVIKASVNITQVLEYYGLADQFTKSSDAWRGPCPIHKGTNPTQFSVSISKNCWKCFSGDCHAHGNVLDFVARMENCKISQAARKLADWFQIQAEYIPNHLRGNSISKQTKNSKLVFERYVITPSGKMRVEMPTS